MQPGQIYILYQRTSYMITNNKVMKTLSKLLGIVAAITLLFSCSTTKLTIYGTPGTQIMNAYGKVISAIDESGQTTIKTDKELGDVFLSKAPNDSLIVPFLPDFRLAIDIWWMCNWEKVQPETRTNNDIVNESAIKAYRESQHKK